MKKSKKEILTEELKRFNKFVGYNYYDDSNVNEAFNFVKPGVLDTEKDNLLFGSMKEAEEDEIPAEEPTNELPAAEEVSAEAPADAPLDAPMPEEQPAGDMGGEVELDVTELVKGSQDAKASADAANSKIEQLMSMVDKLENQISSMEKISSKIDKLEFELEKRAPTPEEKISLRSLDSYPFNIKLTDYWADKTGQYDVMDKETEKEYELTQADIDSDYSDSAIKGTFDIDDNDYEEEEM